jgi:phage gpG-like protein
MTPQEFDRTLRAKATEIRAYTNNRYPSVAGNVALRFINGNFRAQGFQGTSFSKWKKGNKSRGTTLVVSGALRAGNHYTTQPGQTTLKNNMPYAKAHNEGFSGTVQIKAHSRNKYSKAKKGTGKFTKSGKERMQTVTYKSGSSQVRAHQRKMNIPKRQFMPTHQNDSPVLNNAIVRQVTRDIQQLMQR